MDPATRGEIYHAVQFELLREPAACQSAATSERLDAVLQRGGGSATKPTWRRPFRRSGSAEIQAIRADLRGWLQQKAALEPDWTPQFSELSFGLRDPAGRDPHSRQEPVEIEGGFRLQGSIDLVERHASGILRVVDHKTGPRSRAAAGDGGRGRSAAAGALRAGRGEDAGRAGGVRAALLFHHRAELHRPSTCR